MLEVGGIAPEFFLEDPGGVRRSLRENLKSGPVLAVFFKISCPTCQLTLPFLDRLKSKVQLVGISQDDAESTAEFLEYGKLAFPVLIDPASGRYAVSQAYRLTNVPSMFLIEKDGRISWALNGFHKGDLEILAERLNTPLFGPGDRVPEMKPG